LETDDDTGPYGAKGAGELGVELVAPAIANALYHATGRRSRETPLNLERVLLGRALQK
jgi:CO/xanthine dehydrogenase Mo-binding subunit